MKHSVSRLLEGEQHLKSRPSSEEELVDEREKRLDQVEAEELLRMGADEGSVRDEDAAGRAGRGGASTLSALASSMILPIEKTN